MNTALYYRQISNSKTRVGACSSLKDILRLKGITKLGSTQLEWLEGLEDAGVTGANDLIKAIHEFGGIKVKEE